MIYWGTARSYYICQRIHFGHVRRWKTEIGQGWILLKKELPSVKLNKLKLASWGKEVAQRNSNVRWCDFLPKKMMNKVVFNWGSRSLNALFWRKLLQYYLLDKEKFIFQNVEHISANTYTKTRARSPSHLLWNKMNQNFIYRLWKKKKRKWCENLKKLQGRKTVFSRHVTKYVSSFKCQIHGPFKWCSVAVKNNSFEFPYFLTIIQYFRHNLKDFL